jgi:hypothetical protein
VYRTQLTYFGDAVARTSATRSEDQLFVAKIDPGIVDHVKTMPEISADSYAAIPAAQLRMIDLITDIKNIATKVVEAQITNPDGKTLAMYTKDGITTRLVAFDAKPGEKGSDVFRDAFGTRISRLDHDEALAISVLREQYHALCQGDPSEIRAASEF